MLKWICAVAFAGSLAAPAFAQKTDLPDRPAKQTSEFDIEPIREGNTLLMGNGDCTAQFIVSTKGLPIDINVDCTHPEMAPYVVKTIESATYEPEVFDGELFDSFPLKRIFRYGTGAPAADPRGEKSPELKTGVEPKDIERAINQVDAEGVCEVKYTVGVDGKPKDVQPNCTPAVYDEKIAAALERMEFVPGQKDGQPTDWPGMSMPLKLTKPEN